MSIFRCILADIGGPAERKVWNFCQNQCATDPKKVDGRQSIGIQRLRSSAVELWLELLFSACLGEDLFPGVLN